MNKGHIVSEFDNELDSLNQMIAEMGGLVEAQLSAAIEVLLKYDPARAEKIIANDKKIDMLESRIDHFALKLIALRQPMADDLRLIISSLKISNDLERIGDYAKNMARRAGTLAQSGVLKDAAAVLRKMSDQVQEMIHDVLDAYISRDAVKAENVRARDEQVDQLYSVIFRDLLTHMMEDPRNISSSTHLLFIAKNIERMGDHTTNIAEYVSFLVTGEMPDDERPQGDETPDFAINAKSGGNKSRKNK